MRKYHQSQSESIINPNDTTSYYNSFRTETILKFISMDSKFAPSSRDVSQDQTVTVVKQSLTTLVKIYIWPQKRLPYDILKFILKKVKYITNHWQICPVAFLLRYQTCYRKCCFFCGWDSRARLAHYVKQNFA